MRRGGAIGAALVAALAVAACGGGTATEAPASVLEPTAVSCDLLAPADFTAVGIEGAGSPSDNPDEYGGHYCVYAGTSGATGGIELDVFPHDDTTTAEETYATVTSEGPGGEPAAGATFDASAFAVADGVAYLSAREGRLVFAIAVPAADDSEADLVSLGQLVVQRAGAAATE